MSVNFKDLKSEKGMTLVELIMVVVILSMLAVALGLTISKQFNKARPKTAQLAVAQMGQALGFYMIDTGNYPDEGAGLEALVQNPGNVAEWNGPYMNKIPIDPWGKPYIYQFPGSHGLEFDLCSVGEDGIENTDDDICNWN